MVGRLDEFAAYADRLRNARDTADRIELLRREKPSFKVGNVGRKGSWRCDLSDLRERIVALAERRRAVLLEVSNAVIRHYSVALAEFTRDDVAARRAAGELEFHDLLVLARLLLRDPTHGPAARARLARRYERLLIDEFQDTDPIQVDLAVLLASVGSRRRRASVDRCDDRSGSPVLRRRPEAVDLPVPARRHRHLPPGPRHLHRRARSC